MHKDIIPFTPKGELTPPISKSYCHRYLIAAFCAGVEIDPSKVNFCDDVIYTYMGLNLLKSIFESKSNLKTIKINVGQSASTLRMLLLVATYICDEVIFVGDSTLFARPLKPFLGILERQKIEYELGNDYLKVKGKISIEDFDIDGSVSSQFISGLLFLSAFANRKYPDAVKKKGTGRRVSTPSPLSSQKCPAKGSV